MGDTDWDNMICFPFSTRRLIAPLDIFPRSRLSEACGVGHIATAHPNLFGFVRPSPLHVRVKLLVNSEAFGVGHNPDPVASVRRTNGGSWYAVPFRIVPERGQVPENSVKSPSSEG